MPPDEATILDVRAEDIQLGDVLGEGQRVWLIAYGTEKKPDISVWWAKAGTCLLTATEEDYYNFNMYDPDTIVRVFRIRVCRR